MKFLVLAHNLHVAGGASVGLNILRELRTHSEHEFVCVIPDVKSYNAIQENPNFQVVRVPSTKLFNRLLFDVWELGTLIDHTAADIIWVLGNQPLFRRTPFQAVLLQNAHRVYDSSQAGNISLKNQIRRKLLDWKFAIGLNFVDLLFTQTNTVRKRVQGKWPKSPPIKILPNAVSADVLVGNSGEVDAEIQSAIGNRKAFLCLARYYPHKNIEAIVDCYDRYRNDLKETVCILTISESDGGRVERVFDSIKERGLSESFILTGAIPQNRLLAYYQFCTATLLPTLIESFSGTYIEAMYAGCPIATSDRDFSREICGDAAIYFDPREPKAMKDAMLALTQDSSLRSTLIDRGKEQLQRATRGWADIVDDAVESIQLQFQQWQDAKSKL